MTRIAAHEAAAELLRRERMVDSLAGFAEGIVIPGGPIDGDDPKDWKGQIERIGAPVGARLPAHARLLLEKVQACMERPHGRLMVFMPPGSAKSTYCSSVAPVWYIAKNPGTKVILASYADDLAKKHGRKARQIVDQDAFHEAFEAKLSRVTHAADEWSIQFDDGRAQSEYMAGSFLSGITGNRAHGIIIDDPIKGRNEADNPEVRKRTLQTYEDDIVTRIVPGAWMILIQTRWHDEDLAGSLLPKDYKGQSGPVLCRDGLMWEVINLPAECERADDPLGRPIGDGEGGVEGSMLWPEWFTAEHWAIFRLKARTWSALYQQRPQPEGGGRFKRGWFRRFDLATELPKYLRLYCSSDYAVTDEEDADDPDYTEHGIWGVDDNFGLWAVDWWYGQVESDVGVRELLRLARRYKIRVGFNEQGVIRRAIEPIFRDQQRAANMKLHIEYLPHIGNKVSKAEAFRGLANSGRIHIPYTPWGDRLIDQLCNFPGKRKDHDDGVDVCSHIGRAIDDLMAGNMPVTEERPPEPAFGSWEYLTQDVDEKPAAPRVF